MCSYDVWRQAKWSVTDVDALFRRCLCTCFVIYCDKGKPLVL